MKKHNLLIITLLVLAVVESGCGNKANKVAVETRTAPAGPVELKLKWPLGRHGTQSMDIQQHSETVVPGMPQPVVQDMTSGQDFSLRVVPGSDSTRRNLELQFLDVHLNGTSGGKTFSYDSRHDSGKTNILAKLEGGKLDLVLDDSNHVVSVEGGDALTDRLSSGRGDQMTAMFQTMFNGDALKEQMDFAQNLPGKAVQPGDSWPIHREYSMGKVGIISVDCTFTLDSWEKHGDRYCAKIEMDGTFTSKEGHVPGMENSTMTIKDGKTSGETLFDLDMGMFVDTVVYENMNLDISIPNPMARRNPNLPKTMAITSTMKQTITGKFELN